MSALIKQAEIVKLKNKYREIVRDLASGLELDESEVFAVTKALGISEASLTSDVARFDRQNIELITTARELMDELRIHREIAIVSDSYLQEALRIAEENGPNCPLSSEACGERFVQIRDLLRKVIGVKEGK